MRKFILEYQEGLGGFLDAKEIEWKNLLGYHIELSLSGPPELFQLGIDFQICKDKHGL